jgi:hypothetical protein
MLFSLFAVWTCLSCGLEQDVSFDEPEAQPPEGPSLFVLWDENETEVFLNDLDKVLVEGSEVCILWDVLLAAGLEEAEASSLRFDFESKDGFRPSSMGCEPLEGETLQQGYLNPETLNLIWDDALGFPGCYSVRETRKIIGEPAR